METVKTAYWYFKRSDLWDTVKPYWFNLPTDALSDPKKITNEESIAVDGIVVSDIRRVEKEKAFGLDTSGFQLERHDFSAEEDGDFYNQDFADSSYKIELEKWIAELLGAETVMYLSGSIRKRDEGFPKKPFGTGQWSQPIQGVHVDFTPKSAMGSFLEKCGQAEAQHLGKRRFQILNIWRPLFGPVKDWPLGLMDFRSLDKADLIASDVIYPHYVSESFNVFHNESQQWYYVADQMPHDILIFKSFDSKPGVASVCPHASFDLGIEGQRPRESVEMIVLVVYPEDH